MRLLVLLFVCRLEGINLLSRTYKQQEMPTKFTKNPPSETVLLGIVKQPGSDFRVIRVFRGKTSEWLRHISRGTCAAFHCRQGYGGQESRTYILNQAVGSGIGLGRGRSLRLC